MTTTRRLLLAATALLALAACRSAPESTPTRDAPVAATEAAGDPSAGTAAGAPAPTAHVVEVIAEDYAFEAPDEILSGWTTFRLDNQGEETHFLYLTRLPDGHTYDDYVGEVQAPLNEMWYELRSGAIGKAEMFERLGPIIPGWFWTGAVPVGGPGLIEPGGVSQATVWLEPGNYVLECFMKTPEGEFHWAEGMVRPIRVLAEASDAPEPTADIELTLTLDGIEGAGTLTPGTHTVALRFAEQPEVGFGNDVHLARLEPGVSPGDLVPWMDSFNVQGLQNPAPVTFHGGSHERPAGELIYFTVELEPGSWAWISESPDAAPLYRAFTVR
jgi:hypothetical protein